MKGNMIIAFRNLRKNVTFSVINISGLAVGLTCFILLALWVQHELSYDSFYDNSDRLYIAYSRDNHNGNISCWSQTSSLMAPALQAGYPEIKATTRFSAHNTALLKWKDKTLIQSGATVDPGFLTMFGFSLLSGDYRTALNDPYSIILTGKTAQAAPLSWISMNKWLTNYSYRISLSGWVFVWAGFIIITIALLTISIQAVKAAVANPVKSLRNT